MSAKTDDAWWKTLGTGAICILMAGWLYWDLTDFEATGGTRMLPRFIASLYKLGGKWPPVLVLGIGGVCGVVYGIWELKDRFFDGDSPTGNQEETNLSPTNGDTSSSSEKNL